MKDLINRQAAIDALDKRFDLIPMHQTTEILQLRKDLRDLPSVQPEIIRCKDCKYCEKVDHDLMCSNVNSWVIATHDDFGCVLAERRTDGVDR